MSTSTFLDLNKFFDSTRWCSWSRTLHHRDVTTPRCPKCDLLNPNWDDEPESPIRTKKSIQSSPDDDCIEIIDTPPATIETRDSSAPPPPAARAHSGRRANHIPQIPGLVVGVGERGRQDAITAARDRKIKTGFTNNPSLSSRPDKIYTFVVSAAHYSHSQSRWTQAPTKWMLSERDRALTSRQLLQSLQDGLKAKIEREEFLNWLAPEESGKWFLCPFVQVIAEPWSEPMTITEMLDARPFKFSTDNKKRVQINVVLGFQPDPPPPSPTPEEASQSSIRPTPNPKRNQKKGIKKEGIKKEGIKKEEKVTEKRPISAGSAERNISAKRLPIGQPNVHTRARASNPIKEEPVVEDEPLEELEDIIRNAGMN
jgi:hypothetical protein